MDLKRSDLVGLFVELGCEDAPSWTPPELRHKANSFRTLVGLLDKAVAARPATSERFLQVLATVKAGDRVRVLRDAEVSKGGRPRKARPVGRPKIGTSHTTAPQHYLRENGKPVGDAPAWVWDWYRKKHPKLPVQRQGLGVTLRAIAELREAGRQGRALSKEELRDLVHAHFPDRDPDRLMTTIKLMPHRLGRWFGVVVHRRRLPDGFWGYWADPEVKQSATGV